MRGYLTCHGLLLQCGVLLSHAARVWEWVEDNGIKSFAIRCVDINNQTDCWRAAKAGEQWSEIRRPRSISFMQEDKEESQYCASLLVTQHCGVACCPLIVVSLLLLAETLFYWTRWLLHCSGWWTCFWFGFLHISQSLQTDVRAKQNRCVYHFKRSDLKRFHCLAAWIWSFTVICLLPSNRIHFLSPREQDFEMCEGWCRTSQTVRAGRRSRFAV